MIEHLFPALPELADYKDLLRTITRDSNAGLFAVVDELATAFRDGRAPTHDAAKLEAQCSAFLARLLDERNALMAEHQAVLLEALERPVSRRAA